MSGRGQWLCLWECGGQEERLSATGGFIVVGSYLSEVPGDAVLRHRMPACNGAEVFSCGRGGKKEKVGEICEEVK